jgi:hypothetical protein
MDFAFTEEQLMIQQAARDFAQREIAPVAAEFDISGKFPEATIRMAGELGFMGVEVPEEYGGAGLDAIGFALVMEEIAAADAAHSTIISVNNSLYCNGILQYGTEEQKQKYVTPVASGEVVAAYALTEPQSGSDAANMRTRAVRDGDHYVINGKKSLDHLRPGGEIRHAVRHDRSRGRPEGRLGVHDRHRQRGLRLRQDRAQARYPRLGDLRDRADRLPLQGRGPHRRRGRRLQDRDEHPRRRPDRHRGAGRGGSRAPPTRRASSTCASAMPSAHPSAASR